MNSLTLDTVVNVFGMAECINKMEDENARGSLTAALEYIFKDDLEFLKAPYPTFSRI